MRGMPRKPRGSVSAGQVAAVPVDPGVSLLPGRVGVPFTPSGRSGVFDVPSYDDVADLQALFKRFAVTSVANGGDDMVGTYNVVGKLLVNGQEVTPSDAYAVVDRNASFTVGKPEVLAQTRFMCGWDAESFVTMPSDTSGLPDGARVTLVQTGKGRVKVLGSNVIGSVRTSGQYSTLEVMLHATVWWCLAGGGGGGGGGEGTPPAPVLQWAPGFGSISWAPVTGSAGPTLAYGARVDPSDGITWSITGTVLDITQATAGTQYSFEVWGVNIGGVGEWSDPLTHTWSGAAAPANLAAVKGPASFTASWTAVSGANGYRLQYRKAGVSSWSTVDLPASDSSSQVQGLEPVQYEVRVSTIVDPIVSAPSAVVTVTPDPGETGTPTIAHSAYGQYTITNYDASYVYSVDASAGSASFSGDKFSLSSANCTFTLNSQFSPSGPKKGVSGERRAYTYHKENFPYVCGSTQCNCRTSWGSCGPACGGCCAGGGDCGCYPAPTGSGYGGCGCACNYCDYNPTTVCDTCPTYCDDYKDVKDATPAGFVDEFGEWSRVS